MWSRIDEAASNSSWFFQRQRHVIRRARINYATESKGRFSDRFRSLSQSCRRFRLEAGYADLGRNYTVGGGQYVR